ASNSASLSGSLDDALQPTAGSSGPKTATASVAQTYAVAALTALRPAGTAPLISAVNAGLVSTSGATITWTTDQPSDSQVEYGTTATYGSMAPLSSTLVTSHAQALTGLTTNTVYHYRVRSTNASGQLALSGDVTFQTQ